MFIGSILKTVSKGKLIFAADKVHGCAADIPFDRVLKPSTSYSLRAKELTMAVINTNIMSLTTQNNLNKSQSALGTAIERLSSGLRINSAKDDAAGSAIANRMSSKYSWFNPSLS